MFRKEGGREEEPTNAAEEVQGSRIERTCCCLGVLVGVSLIAALVAVILMKDTTVEVTVLRQVHVEGKMATFEMGALLRKRYNEFMGPYYEDGKHVVITSDTDLSKVSALLISAGLWPPPAEQVWNDTMQWQPVPYSYPPRDNDYLLYEENCPRYNQEKERILQAFTEEGLLAPYRDFFHKIATLTNTNFSTPREAFYLNNLFTIQDDIKVANPKWAKHVKRKLMDVARLEFMMMFHNNLLKKLSGGALLHEIIKESVQSGVASRSLVVRIGTPVSVAALLAACVAPPPRPPDPGAALIIELHEKLPSKDHKAVDTIAKRYGFKIYYWDDDSAEPRLIEVVGCEAFCSLETFKHLTQHVLSYDYREDCKLVSTDVNIDGL
ncbi:Venom acid phosphatase Acph-1 [Papilio xuthus]|uniref:acid phosphatase n=1 Tax=Papilio xuthus TaxID=66420 RepID=A0A194PLS5_PAPXU|nr:Venom acid phosphatase Acph-1 [Papilio xuthus]